MAELIHGGDVYSEENAGAVDFSANINPLGLPQSVKKAVIEAAGTCSRYPDPLCRGLRQALGLYENVPPETIFSSNGASEIIFRLVWAFKPRKTLVTGPVFSEYREAAESVGGAVACYLLSEENGFEVDENLPGQIDGDTDLVFLCNPNNPTGVPVSRGMILEIARKCQTAGAMLVIDECFMDFVPDGSALYSAKPLLDEFSNIIILKAFTKIFAMPGVRLGYCMTYNPRIIEKLARCGQPWSVSTFAQAAGIAASLERRFVDETREYVEKERDFLKSTLTACRLKVYDSRANFVFFRAEGLFNLKERLLEKGFLIRSCANFDGLDGSYYRIAVRTRQENLGLIKALEDSL